MHAILIAIGSAGDVFPFIGLARTLKLRGHRVSLCTIPVFRDAVEQHGIAFVPLSDELTYRRTMGDPRLWDPKTSFGVLWQAIAGMIEPVYEYVSAQRHDDIVVVGSLWALGARIAHEKYGIPYLSAQVSPSTLLSAHLPPVHPKFNVPEQMPLAMRKLLWRCIERFKLDRTCAPEINAVRRKVGLETPVKRIFTQWMHSPQGVVCLFPAWFAPPQQDWPQPLHMTGFPLFDGSIPGTPLDDELQRFLDQGSRPLVFTQGSTEHLQGDFYAMALRALERLGARGIFLTGAGQEPLRGLPNHVLQRAYAPLGALLPSCAGLVHPGGIGA
ncbi:glycosyltransferase, partial [Pseudomonas aeruginosa]